MRGHPCEWPHELELARELPVFDFDTATLICDETPDDLDETNWRRFRKSDPRAEALVVRNIAADERQRFVGRRPVSAHDPRVRDHKEQLSHELGRQVSLEEHDAAGRVELNRLINVEVRSGPCGER